MLYKFREIWWCEQALLLLLAQSLLVDRLPFAVVRLTQRLVRSLHKCSRVLRRCKCIFNFRQIFEDWSRKVIERYLGKLLRIVREVESVYVEPDHNWGHFSV